jgi:hypothetical protein
VGKPILLHYRPPKANLWGHLMGRKSPAAFRDGVKSFLDQATRGHKSLRCWLSGHVPDEDAEGAAFIRSFVAENAVPPDLATKLGLTYAGEAVFDKCLDWFVTNHKLLPWRLDGVNTQCFSMSRSRQILGWKFGSPAAALEAGGVLKEHYGTLQYLGTDLTFRDMEEFRWVSGLAYSTLRIQMNEKYLRPRKAVAG